MSIGGLFGLLRVAHAERLEDLRVFGDVDPPVLDREAAVL